MIDRICISINNRCNLWCKYCHFHEKGEIYIADMDVFEILKNVKDYANHIFKIGFVGNGEPFLDFDKLRGYIEFISDCEWIQAYTITNGTIDIGEDGFAFLDAHNINVGFSLDGFKEIHNLNRCGSYAAVMKNVELYRYVTGCYPTFNATVGKDMLKNKEAVFDFFEQFGTRITFSRMIGKYGISLKEYWTFMDEAEKRLLVRRGGMDCTMYGGKCGAGTNNYFFANGKVYYCGNCVDLLPVGASTMTFYELEKISLNFDRNNCYKESMLCV